MVEAYKKFFKNYTNFKGRTSRSDFWNVFLMNFIIGFVLGFVSGLVPSIAGVVSTITLVYELVVLIPGLAMGVRRLHDINKSGWFYFISLIPLVGAIILIVFFCKDSVNENNQYGELV